MVVANIIVKDVKDYSVISKLAEYSADDIVKVDIYDRCYITVPNMLFTQCLGMLYARGLAFEITKYFDTSDED